MELTERFFGVNNRTILYELGLKPETDGKLLPILAEKALNYAGGTLQDLRPKERFVDFLQRQITPSSPQKRSALRSRPRYLKNASAPRCKNLLTIQMFRQSVYPRWLSAPYPQGAISSLPGIADTCENLKALLDLGMPLVLDLATPTTLPGSDWKTDQVTDTEARTLSQQQRSRSLTVRTASSAREIAAPPMVSASSVYQQLDPAWGLYLEGLIRQLCAPEKNKVSVQGRQILALEIAQFAPILDFLEKDSRFHIYGWGSGRIHVGTNVDPRENTEDLLRICAQSEAYIFSRGEVFIDRPEPTDGGFVGAYSRLLQSRSRDQIESIVSL